MLINKNTKYPIAQKNSFVFDGNPCFIFIYKRYPKIITFKARAIFFQIFLFIFLFYFYYLNFTAYIIKYQTKKEAYISIRYNEPRLG